MKEASYYKEIVDKMNIEESQVIWDSIKGEIEAAIKKSAEDGSYFCFLTSKNGLKGCDVRLKIHVRNFLIEKLIKNGFDASIKILPEDGKKVVGIMVSFNK